MSGIEWAPELPEGWSGASLKWLARIYAGGTPDRSNLDYWTNGTIPWLNSGSVNDWSVTEPSELISEEGLACSSARWVPPGSVVMGLAGQGKTKGTAARLEITATTNQSMAAIVPNAVLDYRYLHYWLTSNYQSIRNLAGGDLRDGLNLQHIGSIQVPLPPPAEQRAIVGYLDRELAQIDILIAKQKTLIKTLGERRSVVRTNLATGGMRAGDADIESGLPWAGRIPVTWKVVPLTSVARLESGHTPSRGRRELWENCYIPWISLNDVGALTLNEYVSETAHRVSDAGIDASSARLLPAGTVVLSRDATIGRSSIMEVPMATSQHFADWICGEKLEPRYLWLLFTSAMQPYFESLTNGSTLRTIGMGQLKSFRIPLPPVEEQRTIVEAAARVSMGIDELVARAEQFIALAKERRAALITAAVTGQIDLGRAA